MNKESIWSLMTGWIISRPKVTGFLVFLILFSVVLLVVGQRYQLAKEDQDREMSSIIQGVQQNINLLLKNCYTSTLALALTINNEGVPENFEGIGAKLMESNPSIDAVQLVPNGIIKYIYPLKGHETALNLDILNTAHTKEDALKSINTKEIYFADPLELRQGGLGIVGRSPIFKKDEFWGFSAVIIRLETLLEISGINSIDSSRYYFQFSKDNLETGKTEFFLPNKKDFSEKLYHSISIPDTDWRLYLINKNKYRIPNEILPSAILGVIISILFALFIMVFLKKPAELQELVRKQAQKIISDEIKFKTIFDQAPIGIAHVDSITGKLIEVNDQYTKMLGYTFEEMRNKKFEDITHPDDLDENLSKLEDVKNGKTRRLSIEKRYFHKNGDLIWVNIIYSPLWNKNEEPTTHIAIIEDITARKASEEIVIQSQKKIESLINSIDGIVWECDYNSYLFTYVNKKAEEITGYKIEEWCNDPRFWEKTIHPDDRETAVTFCDAQSKINSQYDFEYRMIAKDGSIIWIRDIVNVIRENGIPVSLKGIMIDITKSKQAEKDLNNSFNLVTEQNKRLLNFSYIVSHNLRSHTSNMQSISSLIETAETDEERNELIGMLQKVSHTLNETMINLNEVVNIQTNINLILEDLNLRKNIEKTLDILSEQIFFKKAIIYNNVAPGVIVKYNPAYLESILLNFISNAIRYSHPLRQPNIVLNSYIENEKTVLEISDNGIGIDLNKHGDKLFGMYKTFHDNSDSRGIGLFITKNQIDAMGGNVTAESEPNVGTTFKIYFK